MVRERASARYAQARRIQSACQAGTVEKRHRSVADPGAAQLAAGDPERSVPRGQSGGSQAAIRR
jgi:hypothetical protein